VYIVDLFPRGGKPIQNNWELWAGINQITYADKTQFDEKITNRMSDHIEFVYAAAGLAKKELPANSALRKRIELETAKLSEQRRLPLKVTRIQRKALGNEATSREIDFSPKRVAGLIQQGYQDTLAQLKLSA
jgi:hypothetical protein